MAENLSASMPALEDFGALQTRYQALSLADRARAMLTDATPVLRTVEAVVVSMAANPKTKVVFDTLRGNAALLGKMRPSEAKNVLLDAGNDFIAATLHKIAAWEKTLGRIAQGEGVEKDRRQNQYEFIPAHAPVAVALLAVSALDAYLAVIQLALGELAKQDAGAAADHQASIVKVRRCATLISDYDHASAIRKQIH